MQNSACYISGVFYQIFTWIQQSASVTEYSKCMGSHITHNITIPQTVRMVHLCRRRIVYCFSPEPLDKVLYPYSVALGSISKLISEIWFPIALSAFSDSDSFKCISRNFRVEVSKFRWNRRSIGLSLSTLSENKVPINITSASARDCSVFFLLNVQYTCHTWAELRVNEDR